MSPSLKRSFAEAARNADERARTEITPVLLLLAILTIDNALAYSVLQAANVDTAQLRTHLSAAIEGGLC
jgi:ATP-dependent Clp protease ATP-binding subunit ClpA